MGGCGRSSTSPYLDDPTSVGNTLRSFPWFRPSRRPSLLLVHPVPCVHITAGVGRRGSHGTRGGDHRTCGSRSLVFPLLWTAASTRWHGPTGAESPRPPPEAHWYRSRIPRHGATTARPVPPTPAPERLRRDVSHTSWWSACASVPRGPLSAHSSLMTWSNWGRNLPIFSAHPLKNNTSVSSVDKRS